MAGKADPRPKRKRGKLPTRKQLGERCQCCGDAAHVERMHLLGGSFKEDDVDLIMLGCGDFGNCRVHPRSTRGPDKLDALAEIRRAMRPVQEEAVIARVGHAGLETRFPRRDEVCVARDCWEGVPCPVHPQANQEGNLEPQERTQPDRPGPEQIRRDVGEQQPDPWPPAAA